ncbi:hypothetical protein E2320_007729, partial [Naja naja]
MCAWCALCVCPRRRRRIAHTVPGGSSARNQHVGVSFQHHVCMLCVCVYAQEGGQELLNFPSSLRSMKAATAVCPFKVLQHGGGWVRGTIKGQPGHRRSLTSSSAVKGREEENFGNSSPLPWVQRAHT